MICTVTCALEDKEDVAEATAAELEDEKTSGSATALVTVVDDEYVLCGSCDEDVLTASTDDVVGTSVLSLVAELEVCSSWDDEDSSRKAFLSGEELAESSQAVKQDKRSMNAIKNSVAAKIYFRLTYDPH